ncbi:MAG: DnaB-like helicase N-terminal domain-containing protein [Planctomycetota bacterium]
MSGSRRKRRASAAEILQQPPPYDVEAEMGVVGSMLLHPQVSGQLGGLKADDFYDDANRILFGHLWAMWTDGERIDVTLLVARLKASNEFAKVGGASYLARISGAVPNAIHAPEYAAIVRECANYRRLIQSHTEGLQAAYEQESPAATLATHSQENMRLIATRSVSTTAAKRGTDVLHGILDRFERDEPERLFNCGIALEGFEIGPGISVILGAPPACGKTAFAMQATFDALANEPDLSAVVASLEMSPTVLIQRKLASMVGVSYDKIRFCNLNTSQRSKLIEAANEMAPILERTAFFGDLVADLPTLESMVLTREPGLLVLDYLQLFGNPERDTQQRVADTMKSVIRFCEQGWSVICIAALNRTGYGKSDQAAFRDSSNIEYGAVSAYLLEDVEEDEGQTIREVRLKCVKNRNAQARNFDLYFNKPQLTFTKREAADPFADEAYRPSGEPERCSDFDDNPFVQVV